ncbi:unnamed protein product [Ilex paraguariensis]|uniref:Pentatricopeptide repeat-containing protein n=1 Tax=Ilex paraguariensis TaxID=185542 RepID=A0ABC8U3J6_9AQUA
MVQDCSRTKQNFDSNKHGNIMFLPPLLPPKPSINRKSITPSLALFFTLPDPPQPNQRPQPALEEHRQNESISNRFYWTKKIHKLCVIDRNVDQALNLLDHLRLRGYRPDYLNIGSIIHALCDAHRFSEAHNRFVLSLTSNCIPDERTCNVLIARLLDARTPFGTLHVIHCLIKEKPEFVTSLMNYNRLIDQMCWFSKLIEAHGLFFDMKTRGHSPNTVSYTTLINGYCKVGEVGTAQKLLDEMSECGVRPNSLTYSVFIRGILRKHDVEHGKKLISKLWEVMVDEDDQSVNNLAFGNLIDCLCREGLFHEVFKIAEDMPQGKSVFDEFAYGQMIDSFCRYGRYNGAARIVYMMRKRGCTPSLVAYNSIVHGLSEDDCMRAYQLLEEGKKFGYLPSEFTYKVLMEGLCRECDLCKAREVLKIMLNKKGVDKTRIYNIYLRALSLTNNSTELLNVLVFMLQTECQPDVITLNTVINGFCKMGRIEESLKVFHDMMTGKFCPPDVVTFTAIICGLLKTGRTEEAFDLLHNVMPKKGLSPGVVTYNAVIRGLFRLHRADDAMEVFNGMARGGVVANSTTYTIIIDGLCESDQIPEAKRLWDEVIWTSKVHDNFVYAAILKWLCRSGKFNEASDFLYELVDCGVTPNVVNYNIVIDGACKLGLKREAYQILGEMRNNGVVPDAVTWRILDKLHGNVKRFCAKDLTYKSNNKGSTEVE